MPASIPNDIYQYSLSTAYTSGLTDGGPPVAFLTTHGTHGIGIFECDPPSNQPNDMIQIDSVTYSISPTGHIVPAEKDDTMPFVMVTVFQPTSRIKLPPSTTREVLQEKLRRNTPLPFCIRGGGGGFGI